MIVKENIVINGIYQHYKGNYYKVLEVAYGSENPLDKVVIYVRCTFDGLYQSIRSSEYDGDKLVEKIVQQPFFRSVESFLSNVQDGYPGNPAIPRFKLKCIPGR